MKTGRYNIAQLLTSPEVEQIIIPELQRDYVWGERNVNGLLDSILDNYNSKKNQTLSIKDSQGEDIGGDISDYLNEEYMRLRYNTRVGFIYAYHDRTLAGQYYLIDGQQRITTIFLVLLALYRRSSKSELFRKLYFVDYIPKIDYKVRDVAHSFLVDFIDFELRNKNEDNTFKDSSRYYCEYEKDVTAQSIYANYYNVIIPALKDYNNNIESLIHYVENYIEFNYFDTNISEQGEKLYLYMNSRGESLSAQERIKPIIIGRSQDKLKAGKVWEDWQNFFWHTKSSNDKNADRGFYEFLKWAVIIHMCKFEDTIIKKTKNVEKSKSRTEEVEDYIRIEKDTSKRLLQTDWIYNYISENESFNFEWLQQVEHAVKNMYDLLQKDDIKKYFEGNTWFCVNENTNTIEYLTLLGLLNYLISFRDKQTSDVNILRMAMYLKNLKSEYVLRRNPDNAVIRCIRLVNWMSENNVVDVRLLGKYAAHIQDDLNDKYVLRKDDLRWGYYQLDWQDSQCIHAQNDKIGQWESFFWEIINNKGLNHFLRGNHDFVIKVLEKVSLAPNTFLDKFIDEIFDKRECDNLRQSLLRYGDISVYDNGGSSNIQPNNWMERRCILGSNSDETYWNEFMNGEKSDINASIIANYLMEAQINNSPDLILTELGKNLNYMNQKYYLWSQIKDSHLRVVLLQDKQASTYKAKELCVRYLNEQIENSWMWEHNFCVVNFQPTATRLDTNVYDKNTGYFIDLWYDWSENGGKWYFRFGHKEQSLPDEVIEYIQEKAKTINGREYQWAIKAEERTSLMIDGPIYRETVQEDYFQSADFVKEFYESFFIILKALYNDGLIK